MTTTDTEVTQADRDLFRELERFVFQGYDGVGLDDECLELLARHRTLTHAQAAGPVLLAAAKLIDADCSYHLQKYRPAQLQELRAAITQAEGPQP